MVPTSTFADAVAAKIPPKTAGGYAAFATSEPSAVRGEQSSFPTEVRAAIETLGKVAPAKLGEVVSSAATVGGKSVHVFLVGLGKAPKAEEYRRAGGALLRRARTAKLADVVVASPTAEAVEPLVTGALLASFEFRHYVGTRRKKDIPKTDVKLHVLTSDKSAIDRARAIATSCNLARTVASRPGNDINPVTLADVAKDLAAEAGLKFSALDEKQLKKIGAGGIIGVGQGSATPPRLIALEYKPAKPKNSKPLLVVGKSITFDTGGISIKGAEGMGKMIYDKSGGMAVLGLMAALGKLKPNVHVVGLLTAAENHVSGTAYRPGDILTMHNGVTVEITNTDAEGRLVLGDAISWGIDTYKPQAVVDLATLTGGCVVALGKLFAGLFSNNDALAAEILAAGTAAGEKYWRLPVDDDVRDLLKSDLADVVNSAGRWASPCTGAAFVSLFVPADNSIPWAHLDIAGMADIDKEAGYLGKGSTGFGVRTLLNWVESKG